jgi:predicted transcriptional regulator
MTNSLKNAYVIVRCLQNSLVHEMYETIRKEPITLRELTDMYGGTAEDNGLSMYQIRLLITPLVSVRAIRAKGNKHYVPKEIGSCVEDTIGFGWLHDVNVAEVLRAYCLTSSKEILEAITGGKTVKEICKKVNDGRSESHFSLKTSELEAAGLLTKSKPGKKAICFTTPLYTDLKRIEQKWTELNQNTFSKKVNTPCNTILALPQSGSTLTAKEVGLTLSQ